MTEPDQAFQSTLAILAKVEPSQLAAPTPCASWDVRALINHFLGTARFWAATVAGAGDTAGADYASGDRCLTALAGHSRRMLPSGLYPPEQNLDRPPEPAGPQVSWLQPSRTRW